jgi:hypothetical protein
MDEYVSKIDRRTAIAWIGAVGAAVGTGVVVAGRHPADNPVANGYGTDPNLVKPAEAPWPRLLTKDELTTAALLADFILPASGATPAASALGVPDFIDEWVSAPYPDQLKDRPIIRDGLKALSAQVLKTDAAGRVALTARLRRYKRKIFFKRFRALTVGAYYTTEVGFRDIGYIGNVARLSDPGPSAEVKTALELQLKKLGL